MSEVEDISGRRALVVEAEGPPLGRDLTDLIGDALAEGAEMVVVPVGRLDAAFFQLRSGVAGEMLQKLVNYRLMLAVVGDVSAHVATSTAFRDLVREANRGAAVLFVKDREELARRAAEK